jgi:hypothetical protein
VLQDARKLLGLKRKEVTGDWRELYEEVFHNLCSSSNVIQVIKLRKIRCVGHMAHIGRRREMYTGFDGETQRKETTWKILV